MSFGTWLFTRLHGEVVGKDDAGNVYYVDRRTKGKKRERRWVIYRGEPEASKVTPEWHNWLHGLTGAPPSGKERPRSWQRAYVPNQTGTDQAYRPPGHVLMGGQRAKATGDYEPWTPA
jgi:NADH:ubiquinone oxidoreductase subunit